MQKEDQIIGMLEKVMSKQDEHSQKLDEHSQILDEHTKILDQHTAILGEHSQKLDNHESTLQEHGQILTALRSGQEHLKAELDGMKVSNAREFGEIKEGWGNISTNLELLRNDTWENKVDIHRIKNTMGMN
ncbi:hypothetical protein KFZ58_15880 [Virgibacillus sp. NKC19-16]|uniref:hypothetical protein n=1 Tax=Virgibacillus salidurans TaxID=2831673 RepID=UPI001F2DC001|nr:hypothetical protein [Virgibacillus sp. NKC19-16]UJL45843.1 hypothetical protein KFZ58_15880 [Virgibacillus sp. NKC19-16]